MFGKKHQDIKSSRQIWLISSLTFLQIACPVSCQINYSLPTMQFNKNI